MLHMSNGSLIRLGYDADSFSANALVDIYAKLGDIEAAMMVFEKILLPDIVSWNTLITGCALHGFHDLTLELLQEMKVLGTTPNMFTLSSILKACAGMGMIDLGRQINSHLMKVGFDTNVFVCVGLVDMYSKCGLMEDARRVFNLMPMQDLIYWNSIISAYVQNLNDEEAISLFCDMQKEGFNCNQTTLSTILKPIASLQLIDASKEIHSYAIKLGLESDVYVTNSLIDAYGKCHYTEDAKKPIERTSKCCMEMLHMSNGSLIRLGYDADSFSANALVDIYAKLGDIEAAMMVFEKILLPDIVSWNTLITGCALHGFHDLTLELLQEMKVLGTTPNMFTLSSILKACAGMGMIDLGRQINSHLMKVGFDTNVFVCVGLVDMYSKCGLMEDARRVFNLMPMQDLIYWNSIISAYVQNLNDEEAISLFCDMQKEGFNCNQTTLSTILKPIASLQLIDASKEIHSYAIKLGLESDVYVTNSLIDAYGKCHYTEDAKKVFVILYLFVTCFIFIY
ncbi:pentatricopeptide repeat-containing protein At4g39530-like [Aristolochia californica]|uniref:pentatricopeptide repeat-containing protein At4g39530-like n=1 Tax=Aristolochia californica TaxID=171875 RepID=UPI0035DBA157